MSDVQKIGMLLSQAQQGHGVAVNDLVAKLRPWVRQQAAFLIGKEGVLGMDASDLAQEVSLRATLNLSEFKGDDVTRFLGWVSRILRNVFVDAIRHGNAEKRQKRKEVPLDHHVGLLGSKQMCPEELVNLDESVLELTSAMEKLPEHQRDIVRYRFFDQRSFSEIGAIVGKSEKNCCVICLRAIERLRRELGEGP
jgi:RNA polymerase sigma-70 factor (ECF subfamily)